MMILKVLIIFAAGMSVCSANGVLRWGFGAEDMGAAGAFGGTSGNPVAAMQVNPALLAGVENHEVTLSARYLRGDAEFKRGGVTSRMQDANGVYPDLGLAYRLDSNFVFGFGVSPISGLEAKWNYLDAPGGIGGISFGELDHDSRFVAVRLAAGLSWQVSENLALGLSAGAIRSEIDFDAPFIFQTNPALENAKVDLDLETDGWAPSVEFGALYQVNPSLRWGGRIKLPVSLDNDGKAKVDYSAQLPPLGFAGAPPFAEYDARARTQLPLTIGTGFSWQVNDRLSIGVWGDWHQWSNSYDQLTVDLSDGSNAVINGALGSAISDRVPVKWLDRFAVSVGAEYQLSDEWTLRSGWRYAKSPIPGHLVTPLNGAILEQAVTVGASWQRDDWQVDLGYGYEFSPTAQVGTSGYKAGEYSNSSLEAEVHHLSLSLTRRF